ncbi:MAG TPA: DUF1648 domain-containing protein [Terracidiphilus sp.]|jgi:uncharacterized membrane protein|nr:DUF1648 domain-containing protein [Terracidiphilus sp.]
MRKIAEALALLLVVFIVATTAWAVWGPHPLPDRIATHFDAAGNPNGWGRPGMLWLMPVMATAIYLLMTWVARFPSAFNFPIGLPAAARPRLEAIALIMIAWLKLEVVALFAWIQCQTIAFARQGHGTLPALFLPMVLLVVFGTIAWPMVAMRRVRGGLP